MINHRLLHHQWLLDGHSDRSKIAFVFVCCLSVLLLICFFRRVAYEQQQDLVSHIDTIEREREREKRFKKEETNLKTTLSVVFSPSSPTRLAGKLV